jgi:mevalonate kinase
LGYYTSSSVFGGVQFYRKEFEFLKSVSKLNFKISDVIQQHLYIQHPVSFESSKEIMKQIKNKYNNDPELYDNLFNKLEKQTKRMVVAIAREDQEMFSKSLEVAKEISKKIYSTPGGLEIIYSTSHLIKERVLKKDPEFYSFKLSADGVKKLIP